MRHAIVLLATLIPYAIANITTKIYENPIVVEHLVLLERLYKSHKFVFFMLIVANVIRISPLYGNYIWPYEVACRLNMVWMYSLWTMEMFCVTMFGYVKIQCYEELGQENYCHLSFHFVEIGLVIWSAVVFPTSSVVLGVMSKQYINGTDKTCIPRSWISITFYLVNIIIYFSLNFAINYIIYNFQTDAQVDLIPELQKQIEWNASVLPKLLLTSFFSTLFAPVLFWFFPNAFTIVSFVIEVADGTANHLIMFYSLHRSEAWKAIADAAEKISSNETTTSNGITGHLSIPIPEFLHSNVGVVDFESSESETMDIEGTGENDIFWIGMKGFHPIPVLKKVMDEEGLWRFMIKDRIILKQIAKYYAKGHAHIPSLHWNAVSSTDDLISHMERQQTGSRSIERYTRSGSSNRDFSNIFYE